MVFYQRNFASVDLVNLKTRKVTDDKMPNFFTFAVEIWAFSVLRV